MTDQPTALFLNTVTPYMLLTLQALMTHPALTSFQLAGGTSIALLTGHRQSVDLDLFTEKSLSIPQLDAVIQLFAPLRTHTSPIGVTYTLATSVSDPDLKVDFCNWHTRFLHPPVVVQGLRLTDLRDSCADKFSAITGRNELKDIWDISELLKHYRLDQMVEFYRQKHPFLDAKEPLRALAQFDYNQPVNFRILNGETLERVQSRVRSALIELNQKRVSEKKIHIPEAYQQKLSQKGIQPKRERGDDPELSI